MKALLFILITMVLRTADAQPNAPTRNIINGIVITRSISREWKAAIPKRFRIPGKRVSQYSPQDWRTVIDSTWGPGLPTVQKLQIFDRVWRTIDSDFACFHNQPVDWDSLRGVFRPEVANGVSRGRFAAIMTHLTLALHESHTIASDDSVCFQSDVGPGVPLLNVGDWGDNRHFGAGLTPMPDSSLLVYSAISNHPLGLVPGDIVLGYDRTPWKQLYKDLLAAQLPLSTYYWWGSSSSAFTHSFLISAGMNWHLFDTIDVVKYVGGDTVHLSTAPLASLSTSIICTEQMDITGIPKPDLGAQQLCTYGIIPGTNIGYIYEMGWYWNAQQEFLNAVGALMNTDALVIDFRTNYGGNMFLSSAGLNLLFSTPTPTIDWGARCSPENLDSLCALNISGQYVIPGTPPGYTKPIAVLTGPGAVSSGDQVALRMKFHPYARFFGKPTTTAFNSPIQVDLGTSGWYFRYAAADAFLLSQPGVYLSHQGFPVDQGVWHTRSAVAQGRDNVVDAARAWIDSSLTAVKGHPENILGRFSLDQNYPNPFNPSTTIKYDLPKDSRVSLKVFNILGQEVATLVNEEQKAGYKSAVWNATDVASGVYFYRLDAGSFTSVKKLLLLK